MIDPRSSRASSIASVMLALGLAAGALGCHDNLPQTGGDLVATPDVETPDTNVPDTESPPDLLPPPDTRPDVIGVDVVEVPCPAPGMFQCACQGQGDCLDGICIEGPDGNICSRNCTSECPSGFECITTSIGGPDPVSICVPQHTRLCRPCRAAFDCQNPIDPLPAVCVPAADPAEGSFCATSCAQTSCPNGFNCSDVAGEGGVMTKLCLPTDGTCECRPTWDGLGFLTSCETTETTGCGGTRTCGPDGLTTCNQREPELETCNAVDDDCNGFTDDVAPVACETTNDYGTCEGLNVCRNGGTECGARNPGEEICNNIDDDCDGSTDEAWPNCPAATCYASEGAYYETGVANCSAGTCGFGSPRPCGLYACSGGGDGGATCAATCTSDAVCVESAHCDLATSRCVPDQGNGTPCDDARLCASGFCNNNFCCVSGDCCSGAGDCPNNYRVAPGCDQSSTCQGSRIDALCVAASCARSAPVPDDRGCGTDVFAIDCSPMLPRYCTASADQAEPSCLAGCVRDADCVPGYYCDEICLPKVENGDICGAPNECVSGWCENGFCCNDGDCCSVASDCPGDYRDPSMCTDVYACQGERKDAHCVGFQCGSVPANDDRGCDVNTEVSDCGPYTSAYCNGAEVQQPARCAFSCTSDSQCDAGFWCNGTCTPKLPDGSFCNGDSACSSSHCNNNICCSGGDCCNFAQDCPATYASAAICDTRQTCQGTKRNAVCTTKVCASRTGDQDDSACISTLVANECGSYPAVRCSGQPDQGEPACASSCNSNSECDLDAFCQNNRCVPKLINGSPCGAKSQCESDHCQNGFCCASGDCCATAGNCSTSVYGSESTCTSDPSCQGDKAVPACVTSRCQVGARVGDDSGCNGRESNVCGYYVSSYCNANTNQNAAPCLTSCTSSAQCDPGANCTNGNCVPNSGAGGACTTSSQCSNNLTCVDGVCCTSDCTGSCRACNLAGSAGICRPIPDGQDPASECGGLPCTGYYWGFEGSTCFRAAAISAATAACGGDDACQTPEDICGASTKGVAHSACHATCQQPTPGTCTSTVPPGCSAITGGTQTCGVGACKVTVDNCSGGAPLACVPGVGSAEICDGIDNDCDGLTDGADPDLVLIACDNQSGVCANSIRPAALCSHGRWSSCTDTQYAAHSAFFQAGTETSCDGRDNDCSGQIDEDFAYTSPAGTVVNGAAQSCGVGSCAGGVTQCATTTTLKCSTDTRISTEICDGGDNDCDGLVDSLDPSLQLVQCQNQTGECNGSIRPATLCASGTWQNCASTHYAPQNRAYEAIEVSCDGKDNNCNGSTDDGLSAPLNNKQLGVCSGSRQQCGGTNGWQDRYDNVQYYDANEGAPDAFYRDENCDGIDGNNDQGIFVSTGGTDSLVCGLTAATACRAPQYAIDSRVSTTRPYVYVRTGTYGSTSSPALNFSKTAQVFGGYNTNWTRAPRTTNGHLVTLTGRDYTESGNTQFMAVRVVGIGSALAPARLADVRVEAVSPGSTDRETDGSGKSSYGIYARSSTLVVERCEVVQANGATGAGGGAGSNASQTGASAGGNGGAAEKDGWTCSTKEISAGSGSASSCDSTGTAGGGGGKGGRMDRVCPCAFSSCNAQSGYAGSNAAVAIGGIGVGGRAGDTCESSTTPGGGSGGRIGHGAGGSGANSAFGQVAGSFWKGFSGGDGSFGVHGGGGGGGGGAGGCDTGDDQRGGGGGGGGAGGCRAIAVGLGAAPGGGSFGVFGVSSTLTIANSYFLLGNGGSGGSGGTGGLGQPGGSGGNGGARYPDPVRVNDAGPGGAGGLGGHSGGGGGGGGGSAFGVFTLSSTANTSIGNSFQGGSWGTGGSGGTGGPSGNPITSVTGKAGINGTVGTVRACTAAGGC